MKVFIAFVLNCATVIAAQDFMNIGRNHDSMCTGRMDGIVFPDPEICDAFVQCQRGAPIPQRCQAGTVFDLRLYYCVAAHTVECGSRRQPNSRIIPPNSIDAPTAESHHSICRNVRNGALLTNPSNCRAFIECQQGLRLDRDCAMNELFDAHNSVCLSDFAVDCGLRPNLPPADDVAIRNACIGQRNGIRSADARDCRRFFQCQSQQNIAMECEMNMLFEQTVGACVPEIAVNCAERPRKSTQRPESGRISQNACVGMPTGTRISNLDNCRTYFECRDSQRLELHCSSNEAYDVMANRCRPASAVDCAGRINLTSDMQQNAVCQAQPNGRRMGDPNNCRAFIECQSNSRIDRTCEIGQLFDTNLESCLDAHLVRCGTRGLPPIDTLSPEEFFPPCPASGVSFRSHPHDCQIYFVCAHGNLIQHSCANGIHFNPETLQCDFTHNVRCRVSRIVIPQTPLLPDCISDQDYFPNLVNCRQYYKCVEEKPQLMDCQNGFLWDNKKLRCVKSDSKVCARSFNAASKTFNYGNTNPDEKNF